MNPRSRRLSLAAAAVASASLAVTASTAAAAPLDTPATSRLAFSQTVTADAAQNASCIQRLRTGSPSVVTRRATGPAVGGLVTARLKAASGDWDLAIFDERTGLPLAQAAGFGAEELAEGFVGVNRAVVVQACRRSGSARTANVELFSTAIPVGPTPEPVSMVSVRTPDRAAKNRLTALGLDVTEHGDEDSVDVVLHSAADAAKLRDAGFGFTTEVADLMAQDRLDRAEDRRYAARVARSPLPSGRDGYRRLGEINEELKALAAQFPNLVKPITLPNKSLEGRDVQGIEVAANVSREDGRPVFIQMGVHHAREWPSVEMPMEFANDLIRNFGKDPRVTDLLERTRVIFVPVVNVDGFNLSREAPVDLAGPAFTFDENVEDSCDLGTATTGVCLGYSAALLADPNFAYKRRNCRVRDGMSPLPGECGVQANRQLGTDPNRNYGALWGGAGASPLPNNDTYRGAGPFSEPETQNIQNLVSTRQAVTLITNHTFSNLILRPPGVKAQGTPPEDPLLSALGKAMSDQNGYTNQAGYELYDTTGTTEDWSYNATGGFGYTFEIGPQQFHPPYTAVVEEYLGKPGTPTEGKGNREAYLKALESTADATKHSRISGKAPKDVVLKLNKEFDTETSPVVNANPFGEPGPVRAFRDKLETRAIAPGGDFTLHTNPSTRPSRLERRKVGEAAEQPFRSTAIGQSRQTEPGIKNPVEAQIPFLFPDYTEKNYEDIPFEIRPEDQVALLKITVSMEKDDDYDIVLYKKNGRDPVPDVDGDDDAGNAAGVDEVVQIVEPPIGEYVLRVNNYDASAPWLGKIDEHKAGSSEVLAGGLEEWTMRCERADGELLGTTKVQVARGGTADVGNVCNAPGFGAPTGGSLGSNAAPPITIAGGNAGLRFAIAIDRRRLKRALRLGIRARVRCTAQCRPAVAFVVDRKTQRKFGLKSRSVARGIVKRGFTGRRTFQVRFTKDARRKLRRAGRVRMGLVAVVRDAQGKRLTARRGFRLR